MWFQLRLENCPVEEVDAVSEYLEELGALSIMLTDKQDNPVLEPAPGTTPLWPEVIIQALFAQSIEAQHAREIMSHSSPNLNISMDILEDKDWERAWMDDFKPQKFGHRLWICPTWLTPPDEPGAIHLMLDPGLAFGTGTHPTTSLCLTWLEQAPIQNKQVIDYGCGSGILSIAALKLGAAHVDAVDIDPQALMATQNNAQSNHIGPLALSTGTPDQLNQPVDLIIANILLAPLISLKDRFHQLILPGGLLVVSGILNDQELQLITSYDTLFTLQNKQTHEGWSLLIFKRDE